MFSKHAQVLTAAKVYKNVTDVAVGEQVLTGAGNIATITSKSIGDYTEMVQIRNDNWYQPFYATSNLQIKTTDGFVAVNDLKLSHTLTITDQYNYNPAFNVAGFEPSFNLGTAVGLYTGFGNIVGDKVVFKFANNPALTSIIKSLFEELFNATVTSIPQGDNVDIVAVGTKVIDFFQPFGNKINRQVPSQYLSENDEYIKGLFEGLSEYDSENDSYKCVTLSENIAKLFVWLAGKQGFTLKNSTLAGSDMAPVSIYQLTCDKSASSFELEFETIARESVTLTTDLSAEGLIVNNLIVKK